MLEDRNGTRNPTNDPAETSSHHKIYTMTRIRLSHGIDFKFQPNPLLHRESETVLHAKHRPAREQGVDEETEVKANYHSKIHKELMQSIR